MAICYAQANVKILTKLEHIVGWVHFMGIEEMKNSFYGKF